MTGNGHMSDTEREHLDADRYGQLLTPLLRQAAGYARSILWNRADAEDAVQQAALKGLERIGTFDATRSFKGWWFAILRNCCIDASRLAGRHQTAPSTEAVPQSDSTAASGRWEALADAMERLSPDHREILRLRYFGGLSYRELAGALHIPEGTIMSRLYHARKALAAQITVEEL